MTTTAYPPITTGLLGVSLVVAILSKMGDVPESISGLFYSFYLEPRFLEIKQGEIWRVITPIFIHFGTLHLLMNAIMLWVLGRLMEPIHGRWLFFIMVVIIAIISNTAQYLATGPLFGGLSGILYGLVGFLLVAGKLIQHYPLKLDPKFTIIIIGWFVICWSGLLSKIFNIQVANMAHSAGLLTGALFGLTFAVLVQVKRHGISRD